MRIPLTDADSAIAHFNYTLAFYLFVDSTSYSRFRKYFCGFRKFANFWNDFVWYSFLGICLWNPKQQKISKKNSIDANSATKLILACFGIHLRWTERTVWPRNDGIKVPWKIVRQKVKICQEKQNYESTNILPLSSQVWKTWDILVYFHQNIKSCFLNAKIKLKFRRSFFTIVIKFVN